METPAEQSPVGLSIFFRAYNDSGTIGSLVVAARRTAQKLTADYEVVVVNDGSADATAEIADELGRTYPDVRVIHHPVNRGYGGALRSGFLSARFRIAEVPVHHYHRTYGRSQFFNFRRLARTAFDVAALWWQLVVLRRHRRAIAAMEEL